MLITPTHNLVATAGRRILHKPPPLPPPPRHVFKPKHDSVYLNFGMVVSAHIGSEQMSTEFLFLWFSWKHRRRQLSMYIHTHTHIHILHRSTLFLRSTDFHPRCGKRWKIRVERHYYLKEIGTKELKDFLCLTQDWELFNSELFPKNTLRVLVQESCSPSGI